MQNKKMIIIKASVISIVSILLAYVMYGGITSLVYYGKQPRFVLPSGVETVGQGFMIQFYVYLAVFIACLLVLLTLIYLFYIRAYIKTHKQLKGKA